MSLLRDYTKRTSRKHFNDAKQFQLCVCPICHRTGKRVNKLVQPAYGGSISKVIHIEQKNVRWQDVIIDVCQPATDEHGNVFETEPEYKNLVK